MSVFDDFYGEGSLEELVDELTLEHSIGRPEISEEKSWTTDFLEINWENSHVVIQHGEEGLWRYMAFSLSPIRAGVYRELSLAFCRAAIARGVDRFVASNLTPQAEATLRASGWEIDGSEATVTPEHLAGYGEQFE